MHFQESSRSTHATLYSLYIIRFGSIYLAIQKLPAFFKLSRISVLAWNPNLFGSPVFSDASSLRCFCLYFLFSKLSLNTSKSTCSLRCPCSSPLPWSSWSRTDPLNIARCWNLISMSKAHSCTAVRLYVFQLHQKHFRKSSRFVRNSQIASCSWWTHSLNVSRDGYWGICS